MESGDLIFWIIIWIAVETVLLVRTIFTLKKRFRTLDISEHELAADFLVQRSDLNSARLKPLCPEPVAKRWKRIILLTDFGIFSIVTLIAGDRLFAEYLFGNSIFDNNVSFIFLFPLFIFSALGIQTAINLFNRRRFRDQMIVFFDGSGQWISEYQKCSPVFKFLAVLLLFLSCIFFIFTQDWTDPVEIIENVAFLPLMVVFILFSFRSDQTALGKPGLFDRGSFVPWSRVLEYRWFEDRSALLLIVDRWSTKSPMVIFPVQDELQEQVEQLLQEFAPDKQREDVEPALEKLDSQDSATAATSSA